MSSESELVAFSGEKQQYNMIKVVDFKSRLTTKVDRFVWSGHPSKYKRNIRELGQRGLKSSFQKEIHIICRWSNVGEEHIEFNTRLDDSWTQTLQIKSVYDVA